MNTELTVALIIMEVLLLVGFLGVIIAIYRFSNQIKDNLENLFETLTGDIRRLREELKSYKNEIDLFQKEQQEKDKSF